MLGAKRQGQNENKNLEKKCMPKFGPKYEQKRPFFAIFRYRRIGRNGRIFGRIIGIRSYTSLDRYFFMQKIELSTVALLIQLFFFVISGLGSDLHCFSENQCCFHESQCYTRKIPASSSVTLIKISKTIFTRKNGFYKRSLRKKLIICVTFVDAHLL